MRGAAWRISLRRLQYSAGTLVHAQLHLRAGFGCDSRGSALLIAAPQPPRRKPTLDGRAEPRRRGISTTSSTSSRTSSRRSTTRRTPSQLLPSFSPVTGGRGGVAPAAVGRGDAARASPRSAIRLPAGEVAGHAGAGPVPRRASRSTASSCAIAKRGWRRLFLTAPADAMDAGGTDSRRRRALQPRQHAQHARQSGARARRAAATVISARFRFSLGKDDRSLGPAWPSSSTRKSDRRR